MLTACNEYSNDIDDKKEQNYLPDINSYSPYNIRGLIHNKSILDREEHELLKEKFSSKPINQQALINRYLNKKCNLLPFDF